MIKRAKIVIIGTGYIAHHHIKVFRQIKFFNLVGISSRKLSNAKKIAKKYKIKKFSSDYQKLIKDIKPDAILILVSPQNIYQVTKNILKYKIPFLVEKPVGLSLNECNELSKLTKNTKVPNMVGLNRRFYSSFLQLHKIFKKEGYPKNIIVEGHEKIWRVKHKSKKVVKNWHYANNIHIIDLINYFGGDITEVETKLISNKSHNLNVSSIIRLKNNSLAVYNSFWQSPDGWSIKLLAPHYSILIKPLEKISYINRKNEEKIFKMSNYDKKFKPGFYLQAKYFQKLIERGKNIWPSKNIYQVLQTYYLIKKIFKLNR